VILLTIRTRPAEMGLEPYQCLEPGADGALDDRGVTVREAFSLPAFWQIASIMLVIAFVTMGLGNHCVAYLTDLEHSPTSAAFAWSVVMGVMILGKLAFGPIADRWGAKTAMAVACSLLAASIVVLTMARPYWVVLTFAAIYGFACGAPLVINPLLAGNYLGMKHFGAVYGVLNLVSIVGGAVGPVGAGIFFDARETYLPVFYLFAGLTIAVVVVAVLMKPAPQETGAGRGGPVGDAS
jgi:MFS family permease